VKGWNGDGAHLKEVLEVRGHARGINHRILHNKLHTRQSDVEAGKSGGVLP
jgi:hypothetical protein